MSAGKRARFKLLRGVKKERAVVAFGVDAKTKSLRANAHFDVAVFLAKVERYLDQDGDGKLTASDLDAMQRRVVLFLSAGLPAGSGFSAGLLLGLRS